jgi:chorismate mutase-like protein
MTLDDLRKDIDRVDEVLVRLLNERARCVCEIGRLKKEAGIEIYQPDREKDVLRHVREIASEGPLGQDAIGRLFERIIDEARRLERRVVHDELEGDVTSKSG